MTCRYSRIRKCTLRLRERVIQQRSIARHDLRHFTQVAHPIPLALRTTSVTFLASSLSPGLHLPLPNCIRAQRGLGKQYHRDGRAFENAT